MPRTFNVSKPKKPTAGFKPGGFTPLRTERPKDRSQWRKVKGGWKKRRFTSLQRQSFRARKSGSTFGGPDDGRPTA